MLKRVTKTKKGKKIVCWQVLHSGPDTGGPRDAPKGTVINEYCTDKYTEAEAEKKARAQHAAIIISKKKKVK